MRNLLRYLAPSITGSVGIIACGIILMPQAFALDNPVLGGTGTGVGDYLEYNSRPDSQSPCNAVSVLTPFCTFLNDGTYPPDATLPELLTGSSPPPPGNAGGNVELFASSETQTVDQFAAYTGITSLSGTLDGVPVVLSSLTWADWQIASYDCSNPNPLLRSAIPVAGGLLDRWFDDLLAAYSVTLTPPQRAAAITDLVCANFVGRLSDPNIAYVNDDNPDPTLVSPRIGLAGTYDVCDATPLPTYIQALCAVSPRPPLQISEVVKLEVDGLTTVLYNFTATESGQSELQIASSHTGIYEFVGPFDPVSGVKVGTIVGQSGAQPIIEWSMTWVNAAAQDIYVRILDPLTDGAYVAGSLTCELSAGGVATPAVPIPTNLRYGLSGSGAQGNGTCAYATDVDGIIGNDGVLFEGVIPGTSNTDFDNTLEVTFQFVPSTPIGDPVENIACMTRDSNQDGDADTPAACVKAEVKEPPTPVPAIGAVGVAALSLGLIIMGGWARRRQR